MRVLFLPGSYPPCEHGGVQRIAVDLVTALRARGVDVRVVGPSSLDLPAQIAALAEVKRELRPDVVHVSGANTGILAHLLTERRPTVFTLHGPPLRERTPIDSLLEEADWVAGCSASVLEAFRRQDPGLVARSSVILNASPRIPPTREGPGEGFLCAGRLTARKGFDLALRALTMGRLRMAGQGPDEPLLRSLAAGLPVEFLGPVDDLTPEYLRCRAVVMPSREEGFGLVALEAALHAVPVIASRVDGLPEVVADGESGLLVEPENVPELEAAMRRLHADPELAVRLGKRARTRALELFSWERHVESYLELYRRLARPAR